jgi:hypothetical protein
LLHPLQEVGDLPRVLSAQLQRAYVDPDHPEPLATYILGRQQAYDLYLRFFAQRALEGGGNQASKGENPERALSVLSTALDDAMSEEERQNLKFMMLYYGGDYEGRTVHLPVSWVSKQYDNPQLRNPDGGIFADVVIFKGKTDEAKLHCVSTLYGEKLLGVNVPYVTLERQSLQYTAYRTNVITKKGSWLRRGSERYETVAVPISEPQTNTGIMGTGPKGQLSVKSQTFEMKNGSVIKIGDGGAGVNIDRFIAGPSVLTSLGHSHSSAGGTTVSRVYPISDIQPASVISTGGIKGRIGKMEASATHMTAIDKDINLSGEEANLSAHRETQNLGTTVTKEGRAVTVTEMSKEIAMPCAFKALNGNVLLNFENRLHGEATQFYGKLISLDSKEIDIETLMMTATLKATSVTQSTFSKQTAEFYQESPSVAQCFFVGDEVHFHGENTKIGGAHIQARVMFNHTTKSFSLVPSVKEYYERQSVKTTQPLRRSEVGRERGQELMMPTSVNAEKIIKTCPESAMAFTSVDYDKLKTIIEGEYQETFYQLKNWERTWESHEQVIPDEALVVAALAISIATQGVGGSLFSSLVSTATGGTMVATGTGMAIASAAFTSACTQLGTSVLRDGDPLNALKSLCSGQGLRSLGASVATAGLMGDAPTTFEGFAQRLMVNGLRSVVRASVSSAIEKRNFGDALKDAGIDALVSSISASIAEKIGEAASAKANPLTPIEHKLAHFALGAGMGAILDHDNPLAGGITGGAGAVIGEMVAESLVDREQVMREAKHEAQQEGRSEEVDDIYRAKLRPYVDIGRLVAGSVIAATGHNPSIAIETATNALENNFAKTVPLSDTAQTSDANLKDEKAEDEEDPELTKKSLKVKKKSKGKGKEKATTRLKEEFAEDAGESYLEVSGLQEEFLHDPMNHPQRLYFEMAGEKAERPEPQPYLRDQEKYFDEAIEAVNKDLKNPHLAFFEKVSLRNYRDALRETQHQVKSVRTITNWAGEEIPSLKRISVTNGRHIQSQIDQNLKSMNNPNLSFLGATALYWQMNCLLKAQARNDLIPVHKGEVALLALSLNPGVKALGTLNPKRLLRSLRTEALDLASVTAFRVQGAANVSATILQRANLRGEARITDKIFSFTRSEHGGGRGFKDITQRLGDRSTQASKLSKIEKVSQSINTRALDLAKDQSLASKRIVAQGTPNAGGSITSFVTEQEEVYYRVYSGENTEGWFLTKVRPKNATLAQEGLALPPLNTAEYIQEVIVPAGIRLQRSRALPVPKWGKRGAMEQFQIFERDLSKIIFKDGIPFK